MSSDLFSSAPAPEPIAPSAPAADSNDQGSTSEGRLSNAMDVTLHETLRALEEGESAAKAEGEAIAGKLKAGEPVDDPGAIPGPQRGPDGKFLPKDAATAAADAQKAPAAVAPNAQAAAALAAPPASWKPAAKAEWNNLPEAVKADAHRREADFHAGIQQYKGKADVADILYGEIAPYEAAIRAAGTDVPGALRSLLQTGAALMMGTPQQKAATVQGILQTYGVDPRLVFAQQQPAQQQDPAIARAQARIAQLERAEQLRQQQTVQSTDAQAMGIISSFANNPANKYFADVAPLMGSFLSNGAAASMEQAYEMACRAHPQVFAAQQAEAAAAQRAANAKAARVSRQSLSPSATPGSPVPNAGSWEEGLRARFRELNADG
jgi:hypothetical protein